MSYSRPNHNVIVNNNITELKPRIEFIEVFNNILYTTSST